MNEEALFHEALAKRPGDRAAFLDQACAGQPDLRAAVDALLTAHVGADNLLDRPAPAASAPFTRDYQPAVISEKAGSRIGPYRLMEQIGEGGFGMVFVAEQQEPVRRKVALKVIKAGMDTREVMARFTAERQALALMDHPNIARVLDAGATDSGRPYFVMELVRGIPITDYCDQNHLSPRERLDLFITVCQAVQHAHQKGIIHRDIKPSNVLVTSHDGKPVAKVIDFGVAKAINQQLTERTVYTQFAQMIGTPLYMSPEQAEMSGLDIDTRSDIYSLGVLLYELLTGTTPFDKKRFAAAAFDEIRRMIREEEPPKPSTRLSHSGDSLPSVAAQRHTEPAKLSKLMRGDLDWITMKALEKDRTRRYETANGLARDVQRYLNDEPVEACPPSSTYRLRKFARKNRAVITTTGAIMLLLVTGVSVCAWQAVRATRAEAVAVAARDAEADQRHLAEANAAQALVAAGAEKKAKEIALAREVETRAVLDFVEDRVIAAARPEGQKGGLGRDVTLRQAIETALPLGNKGFADQPLIEARLRTTLGKSLFFLGEPKLAADQLVAARQLFGDHGGKGHPDMLQCMSDLGNCYEAFGQHSEALKLREETLDLRRVVLGPEHPKTLESMSNLALSYSHADRDAESMKLNEAVLAIRKIKLGVNHVDTLMSMNNLACNYYDLKRFADALKLREDTLALQRIHLAPKHPDTLLSMSNLAKSYTNLGRHIEALALDEEVLRLRRSILGPSHPNTLMSMNNLAVSLANLGRNAEALTMHLETLTLRKEKHGFDHEDTLRSRDHVGRCYTRLGQIVASLQIDEETLAIRKAKLGPHHADTLVSMNNVAVDYTNLGRHKEAFDLHEKTFQLRTTHLGLEHGDTRLSQSNLTQCYLALNQPQEAIRSYENELVRRKTLFGANHTDTLASMMELANCYCELDRPAEALKLCEETLALQKAKMGQDHDYTLGVMSDVAICLSALGRQDDALRLREEALATMKAKLGPTHRITLVGMNNLAVSFTAKQRHAEALALHEATLVLRKANLGLHDADTLLSMRLVGLANAALGRHDAALKVDEETLAIRTTSVGSVHASTLANLNSVALDYTNLGQHEKALTLYAESHELRKANLGPANVATQTSMANLFNCYVKLGRLAEAIKVPEELLALRKATLGATHVDTLKTMNDLADGYSICGRRLDGLKMREELLALRRTTLGPDHLDTLASGRAIISDLVNLDRVVEAIPLIDDLIQRYASKDNKSAMIPDLVLIRMRHFEKSKDIAGCRATAEIWENLKRTDALAIYDAACYRAGTAAIIRANDKSDEAEKDFRIESDRAMAWLQQSIAAGFKNVEHMKKDNDIDSLRGREDFKKLMAELEKGAKKQ